MPARRQVAGSAQLAVDDGAIAGHGPDRPVAALDEQHDQAVQSPDVDDRIVSGAH